MGPSVRPEGETNESCGSRAPLLLPTCAVLRGIATSAGPARVSPSSCQDFQGGPVTVRAGTTITLWMGVSEHAREVLAAFIHAQTTTITIDQTTVDLSHAWSTPEKRSTGDYASFVTYPTGIALQTGDSLKAVWVTTLAYPVPGVLIPAAGGDRAGMPVFDADSITYTCTVTAA